ncbi:DUF6753 family protein [Tolypothrix bouteillei VB521301_2]|uniref:Uncharacterized protein n=1 Tax=Tolypothrix bouteillei VB521301 TaxID=1479485 RepID=A0A0C1R2F6_9CYAN
MEVKKEYQRAKHNLAKALENESAEHRADVLQFVLDWNIHPDEEFFLIFAAIGHLKILIEQAPEDIRQLFKSVLQELDEWSQITTEKLQIDSQHIKVTESLATSSKALGTALNSLDITSTQLLEQLKSLPELLKLLKVVAENAPNMSLRLEKLNQSLEQRKFLKIELTEEQLLQLNSLISQDRGEIELLRTKIHTTQTMITGVGRKIQERIDLMEEKQLELISQISRLQNKPSLLGLLGIGQVAWSYRLKVLGVLIAILVAFNFVVGNVVKGAVASALESTTVVLPVDVIQKLDYASEQSGYATVKLQRIEKALGIKKR